ncbi:MAG TPA: BamA/TamA family outer membrane protein [Paludibacter sp.]|nr:BamA/TamA family outer membrane protein [Paludibacter sp.]
MKQIYLYLFSITCMLLASCSGIRHLPEGAKLYTGAEVKMVSSGKVDTKKYEGLAGEVVRPFPNKAFLGMRPRLWMYMLAGNEPKGPVKKALRKYGEPPVLLSDVKPVAISAIIDARLFNMGIFKSYTESRIVEGKRTAKIIYTSHIHSPYVIKELTYSIPDSSIDTLIQGIKKYSPIKKGATYNLENLQNERIRIDSHLKNKGYFYFSPDYLVFRADTSETKGTVSLQLALKDSVPRQALQVYRIRKVVINPNYTLNDENTDTSTFAFRKAFFVGKKQEMNIRPGVIYRSVYLRKNEVYSREYHNITLHRLMSMGNFKFVQVKIAGSDTTAPGFLDVKVLLTPIPDYTFRAEMDLVSKSSNYTGPRLNLSMQNKNTFHGAEVLDFNMSGAFEVQLGNRNLFSYNWNPQLQLTFPRLLVPFKTVRSRSTYTPKTAVSMSYNFMKRVNYFDLNTFQFSFGYKWKGNIKHEHEFNPVSISYTSLTNKTASFVDLLARNPFLKKSYEEQFVGGINYAYTYNEQVFSNKKVQYYFHGTAETAGNAFSLAKILAGESPSPGNPSTLFGSVYSQYAKFSADGRLYYNFRNQDKMVLRLFAGIAQPYGNSSTLPYSKQFFAGGPNSIRAFPINSLGPGTYRQIPGNTGFLQLGGEVKMEMNAEYRFGIYRFVKGALFVDAGNVWLQKSNPAKLGNPFVLPASFREVAVGAGFGIRIDVSFFVLRFDLAMPLQKPWLPQGERWVTNQVDFGNPGWRKDNLILNIAIGYPF